MASWQWWRVVSCEITPVAGGEFYDLGLELVPTGGDAPGPPEPPYTGDVFAGIQGSTNDGSAGLDNGKVCYGSPYHVAAGGWDDQADTGPISTNAPDGDGHYHGVTVSQAMVARLYAGAWYNQSPGTTTETLRIQVNGVTVGSASSSSSIAFLYVDLRDYTLAAGDVITVDSTNTFWSNSGTNGTQLIVGRGSFPDIDLVTPGGTTTFVGP